MPELIPEQQVRKQIDAMLAAAGWSVQDYRKYIPALRDTLAKAKKSDSQMSNKPPS